MPPVASTLFWAGRHLGRRRPRGGRQRRGRPNAGPSSVLTAATQSLAPALAVTGSIVLPEHRDAAGAGRAAESRGLGRQG